MVKEDSYYFSNDDILGGLKSAIERGESLKDAMMSFYNAGYSKEDIEESARRYMMESTEESVLSLSSKDTLKKLKDSEKKEETKKVVKSELSSSEESNKQRKINIEDSEVSGKSKGFFGFLGIKPKKISDYNVPKKKKLETTTIILISLLLFLVLILGVVFLFKQELVDLFNKWLG